MDGQIQTDEGHLDGINTVDDNVVGLGEEQGDQGQSVLAEQVHNQDTGAPERRIRYRSTLPLVVGLGVCGTALMVLSRTAGRRRRRKQGANKELVCRHILDLTEPSVAEGDRSVAGRINTYLNFLGVQEYPFVVSDRVNIAGVATNPGGIGGKDTVCTVSAPAVDVLIERGASCVGVVPTMHDASKLKEYLAKVHETVWCGAADVGATVALRKGICRFALCVDDGGNTVSSIVCGGLFGYRPTSGLVILDGCAGCSPTLSSLCIAARDPSVLTKVSVALNVPKIEFQDDVERYLVAEDLFSVCSPDVKGILPSVIQGVKRWAGPDQAQALSLCQWIHHKIPSIQALLPEKERAHPSTGAILDAMAAVVDSIISTEVVGRESETYTNAIQIAEELSIACRNAMQEGLVFVIPVCSVKPPCGHHVRHKELEGWEHNCKRFASISALAGIPEVVLPIKMDDGSYLGIGILAMQRKDSVLLRAVGKISQYIDEERSKEARPQRKSKQEREMSKDHVSMAEQEKDLGNSCFKMKKFEQAIQHYSRAVQLDANNPVYLSNRAMAYLKLGAYEEAEEDCTKALEKDPCLVKVFLRRGAARAATARFQEAKSDFERVLLLEPQNKQAKVELKNLASLMNHAM